MSNNDSIDDLRLQLAAAVTERDRLRTVLSGTIDLLDKDTAFNDGRNATWWFAACQHANVQCAQLRLELTRARNPTIPPLVIKALTNYAEHGLRPGQCVYAVLTGGLFHAFAMADPETARAMPEIVTHVVSRLKAPYGNRPTVDAWIARGGRSGGGR